MKTMRRITLIGKITLILMGTTALLLAAAVGIARRPGPVLWIAYQPDTPCPPVRCPDGLEILDPLTGNRFHVQNPDLNQIHALQFSHGQVAYDTEHGLYRMGLSGAGKRLLYSGSISLPTWSPNGTQIAFYPVPPTTDLYLMDVNGEHLQRLSTGLIIGGKLEWSPDGQRIAFQGSKNTPNAGVGIYVINRDGSGLREYVGYDTRYAALNWAPDSRHLALLFYENNFIRTDLVDVTTGEVSHLVQGMGVQWVLGDRSLVYFPVNTAVEPLALLDLDHGTSTPLLAGKEVGDVQVAPDGHQLLYRLHAADEYALSRYVCTYNLDSHAERCFTDVSIAFGSAPVWISIP